MKLRSLEYFVVLAEELHFRRAAERLAISQPPLSAAIRDLEEELGVSLFARTSRMVQLTPAGAALLAEARGLLGRVSRVGDLVRAAEQGARERLDIGVAASLLYREVPKILGRLEREMPSVEIVLHELSTSEQMDKLARRHLHAGFVLGAGVPSQLDCTPLNSDTYALCLPENHRCAHKRLVNLQELDGEPFVMFSREVAPANHDKLIAIFSAAGIHPRIVHSARTWMMITAMVSQGFGAALVPRSLGHARLRGVRLVAYSRQPAEASALLAWNPEEVPPALAKLIECTRAVVKPR